MLGKRGAGEIVQGIEAHALWEAQVQSPALHGPSTNTKSNPQLESHEWPLSTAGNGPKPKKETTS